MARKAKKKTGKMKTISTDWMLGQPLPFPERKNSADPNLPAKTPSPMKPGKNRP